MSSADYPLALAGAGLEPGAEAVVRVSGLNHQYGQGDTRSQVLFDNNLEIAPGEIVILTGPSGSGKTTLLTLISGLRTVQSGSVRVLGRELRGLGPAELIQVPPGPTSHPRSRVARPPLSPFGSP